MAIPTYDKFIEPILRYLTSHPEGAPAKDVHDAAAAVLNVSDLDRQELLPSGVQPIYKNRAGWAHDRLKRAGLSTSPRRGYWQLTQEGIQFAEAHPRPLSSRELDKLAVGFNDIRLSPRDESSQVQNAIPVPASPLPSVASPDDRLGQALSELRTTGVSVIKVYFQPGSNADAAASTISNLAMADIRDLPPGTLPPIVLKFDASSLPVCLVTLKGPGLTETALKDIAQNNIRNQLGGVSGASVPQPFGGRWRQIQFYVDPFKLEANQLSLMDVVRSLNETNVILPGGDVQIGHLDYDVYANNQVDLATMNRTPIKIVGQSPVRFSDIGEAKDSYSLQYNAVRVDGQRSVYLPVLKQGGDSNTIAVVNGIRALKQRGL